MRKSRFGVEQIVGIPKEADAGVGGGEPCRKYGISDQTYCRWKAKYGGMEAGDVVRLRALEVENRKLRIIVAEQALGHPRAERHHLKRVVTPAARRDAVRVLDRPAAAHGRPRAVTVDNGTARTARAPDAEAHAHGVEPRFSYTGTPTDDPFIESLDDRFCDERLNQRWFGGLADARVTIENWRIDYNSNRPLSSRGSLTPCESAAQASAGLRSAPPSTGPLNLEGPATLRLSVSLDQ